MWIAPTSQKKTAHPDAEDNAAFSNALDSQGRFGVS